MTGHYHKALNYTLILQLTDNVECQPDLRLKGHSKEG